MVSSTLTPSAAQYQPSAAKACGPMAGVPDSDLVRLRVSFKGRFVQDASGSWRYLGGDHFLESLPKTTRYADLMFALSEKVDGAVSVKYLLPGEELDPDSLISVNDDGDINEMFHEYQRAMKLPGTPVKTFRLRLFLFPAAEDPYTPEDLAYLSSRTNSADKLGRDSVTAPGSSAAAAMAGHDSALTKAFHRAAATAAAAAAATPSSFSSELSFSSAPGGTPSEGAVTPTGAATAVAAAAAGMAGATVASADDTELAWEAGFRAGQEAAALAAKEEWQALVVQRMRYLGHVQSDWMLSAAEMEAAAAADAAWPEDGCQSPWDGVAAMQSSGLFGSAAGGGGGADGMDGILGALDDIDYDPDAEEAAEAAEQAAAEARRAAAAAASQPASVAASRQPSPRATLLPHPHPLPPPPSAALGGAGAIAAVAAAAAPLLLHPQPLSAPPPLRHMQLQPTPPPPPPRQPSPLVDSLLVPQPSVVMEDAEPDAEFQSMFESKYEAAAVRRSPGAPQQQQQQPAGGSGGYRSGSGGWAAGAAATVFAPGSAGGGEGSVQSSGMRAAAPSPPIHKLGGGGGGGSGGDGSGTGSGSGGVLSASALATSPNSLLPTHISVFGDGVSGLDLVHAAAAVGRPPAHVQLPSHISEFGGDDDEDGLGLCEDDGDEHCLERDAAAMSVAKAALPEDDGELLAEAVEALRRHPHQPLPPDAVQLPTSFELLGGAPGGMSPCLSPRMGGTGMAAAAGGGPVGGCGGGGGGGLADAGAGALPHQPADMHRSPSLENLLSKVQRIDANQVTVLAKIGEGAFGEVSLAQCPTYGRVAVKWIKPTKVERHWASFWHEAELMSRLNHPNVLRFFGLVVDGPMVVGIMTEFAAAGSLASYLRSGVGFIPLRQRAQLALHAVNGMAYLHSLKVVHFDVKPDNLLVDGDWLSERGPVVKVADFGLSKHKYNTFCSNVHDLRGTLPYMAPEMIMDHTHVTEKADVWSLGVVFWEMLTLEVPFADMPPAQLIGALGLGKLRLAIPDWCEPDWRALMESCWVEDPLLRPSCRQLATHLERIRDMAH